MTVPEIFNVRLSAINTEFIGFIVKLSNNSNLTKLSEKIFEFIKTLCFQSKSLTNLTK